MLHLKNPVSPPFSGLELDSIVRIFARLLLAHRNRYPTIAIKPFVCETLRYQNNKLSGGYPMEEVVIAAAARTAIGNFMGSLSTIPANTLGAKVIQALLGQTGVKPEHIDEVILGQVLTAGTGQNPARTAALNAGLPIEVPCLNINKVCGSGLKAVHLAYQSIRDGDNRIVIAGGQENMSLSPHLLLHSRRGTTMGDARLVDSMLSEGLHCAINHYHMGITAENIAAQWAISREEQDAFSAASQEKAVAAINAGRFKNEIVPIKIPQRKGDPLVFDTDEFPRAGTTPPRWASCDRRSSRMARSPLAMRPALTTALPPCW
jgi:acetyl-CoA C-acetyltransferase